MINIYNITIIINIINAFFFYQKLITKYNTMLLVYYSITTDWMSTFVMIIRYSGE